MPSALHSQGPAWPRPRGARSPVKAAGPTLETSLPVSDADSPSAEKAPEERCLRLCRALNFSVALIGILVTAPLMALIAAVVRLTSRGPVLFLQTRVGFDRRRRLKVPEGRFRREVDYGGKLFTIYKFRTMYDDAYLAGQVWAKPGDPRITPVGRLLRKYRLDELPQLFNVLKGEMNIVGPRPEQPEIFLELRNKIQHYDRRQKVLPGITGWAQVNHPYDQCIDDVRKKVGYDLEYIERRSPWQDLRIMLRTLPVILLRRGSL